MENILNDETKGFNRRSFLTRTSLLGGALLLPRLGLSEDDETSASKKGEHVPVSSRDKKIIIAAEIAEALAVTTYSNIINTSPFFTTIPDDDQAYLAAALQEEMSHYALLQSVTNKPSPFTAFFYPPNMFQDPQTTLNVLVTLEDAFIAAYLVGVRDFSNRSLRVTAARIMGIESDHRSLARVIASDLGLSTTTGAQGVAESVSPPNNNGYERTLEWTNIDQAVAALTPFADATAAGNAGFDTGTSFAFSPFTPTLPNPLGDFISFGG
ncbi:MAG TPA: ferritin-like domain-containing protein [Verrucomicrobiae bacterium]|nr:ferritin-like domain-containing protein [Verrucomicrobiae bacterium]